MESIVAGLSIFAGEILRFSRSVINQWRVLVTGAAFTLLLGIGEHYLQRSISVRQYLGIVIVLIFLACFMTWREQYRAANVAKREAEESINKERPEVFVMLELNARPGLNEKRESKFVLKNSSNTVATNVTVLPLILGGRNFTFSSKDLLPGNTSINLDVRIDDGPRIYDGDLTQLISNIAIHEYVDSMHDALHGEREGAAESMKFALQAMWNDSGGREFTSDTAVVIEVPVNKCSNKLGAVRQVRNPTQQ